MFRTRVDYAGGSLHVHGGQWVFRTRGDCNTETTRTHGFFRRWVRIAVHTANVDCDRQHGPNLLGFSWGFAGGFRIGETSRKRGTDSEERERQGAAEAWQSRGSRRERKEVADSRAITSVNTRSSLSSQADAEASCSPAAMQCKTPRRLGPARRSQSIFAAWTAIRCSHRNGRQCHRSVIAMEGSVLAVSSQ